MAKTGEAKDFARIFAGQRTLGMEKDDLYLLAEDLLKKSLFSEAKGRKSLASLTRPERWRLIQELSAKGAYRYRSSNRPAPKGAHRPAQGEALGKGNKTDIISPAQQELIETLFIELASLAADFGKSEYRRGFIRIVLGKEWPQKKWEAQKIIEAVKKRLAQEKKKNLQPARSERGGAEGEEGAEKKNLTAPKGAAELAAPDFRPGNSEEIRSERGGAEGEEGAEKKNLTAPKGAAELSAQDFRPGNS